MISTPSHAGCCFIWDWEDVMSTVKDRQTIDMFGCEIEKGELSTQLERLLDEDSGHGWPDTLRDLFSLIERVIDQHRDDELLSITLLSEICKAFGGDSFYLPKGQSISSLLRAIQVWKEFKGNNAFELSRKYKVSVREIQFIVARMRRLEMRRRQVDMFAGLDPLADGAGRKNGRPY
jgi:Mor family transcriptional regulator